MKKQVKSGAKKLLASALSHDSKSRRVLYNAAQFVTDAAHAQIVTKIDEVTDISRQDPELLCEQLAQYDLVSFDAFDTLILRAVDDPKSVFSLWGMEYKEVYGRAVRREVEQELRANSGGRPVTMAEIYQKMERRFGIPWEQGMEREIELEMHCCMPNPYMKQIYQGLLDRGIKPIITSDMYLPKEALGRILEKCGYNGYEDLYVSSDCGKKKSDGTLFRHISALHPEKKRCVHVGDSLNSDVTQAQNAGWDAVYYKNVRSQGIRLFSDQMSPLVGSFYRGVTDAYLFNGLKRQGSLYDIGFLYFGLPVFGFCQWLHDLAANLDIDLILFAARDMHVVYTLYTELYDTPSEYLPISRAAVFRLGFPDGMESLLGNMAYTKNTPPRSVQAYFHSQNLELLLPWLEKEGISPDTLLSPESLPSVRKILLNNEKEICAAFAHEREAAIGYYNRLLKVHAPVSRILFVDLNGRCTSLRGVEQIIDLCGEKAEVFGALMYSGSSLVAERVLEESLHIWMFSCLHNVDLFQYYTESGISLSVSAEKWVFTNKQGSLLSYTDGHGGLLYSEEAPLAKYVDPMQKGILDSARVFSEKITLPSGKSMRLPPRDCFYPMMQGMRVLRRLAEELKTGY